MVVLEFSGVLLNRPEVRALQDIYHLKVVEISCGPSSWGSLLVKQINRVSYTIKMKDSPE